jgi:hypothetical protein
MGEPNVGDNISSLIPTQYQPDTMPNPQTNVRLSADTRARASAAAKDTGLSLSAWIENAVIAYLDGDKGLVSGDSSEIPELKEMVSDLVSRVERLEGMARRTSPAPSVPPPPPAAVNTALLPAPGEGLTTTEAWQYCQQQGYRGSKDAFRNWAKRNPADLLQQFGLEATGYQGKSNTAASYRRVQ